MTAKLSREDVLLMAAHIFAVHELYPLTPERVRQFRDLALASLDAQWVSVGERLPKIGVSVLVYGPRHSIQKTCHDGRDWILPHKSKVTHWQPLPAPPKGEE